MQRIVNNLHPVFFLALGTFFLSFQVSAQLDADFSVDKREGCGELLVNFTDESTGSPNSWEWDFGDGVTSNLQNPSHFYDSPGSYTVELIVSDGNTSDTVVKTTFIAVYEKPVADLSADDTLGCAPFQVNFSDLSTPGDAPIDEWLWDFGDGNTSNQQDPTHTYTNAGTYSVNLFVTDTNGCTHQVEVTDHIQVFDGPSAAFDLDREFACEPPLEVNFTNNSSGDGLSYSWDLGDGTTSSDETPPTHSYDNFGEYPIELVVTDSNGCTDTATRTVTVAPFETDFAADTLSGCPPLTVKFSDSSSATANSWDWDFGDGGTSNQQDPTHSYTDSGLYSVTLISSGPNCSDTTTKTAYINVHPNPGPGFTVDDSVACSLPFTANFTDTSQGGVEAWAWDFGDGSPVDSSQNPSHSYSNSGDYSVSLTVRDTNGCTASLTKQDLISIDLPSAKFSMDSIKGCKPLTVDFTDASSSVQPIDNYYWDLGDGDTAMGPTPSHTYNDTGSYTVTLVIENSEGCRDTTAYEDTIKVGQPPDVDFTPKDTVGCHPFEVEFTDSSSSYAEKWYWEFGDGGKSTDKDPIYEYQDTGFFDVTHVATFHGCSDTLVVDSAVQVLPPKPQFNVSSNVGCDTPSVITFTDNSQGADSWYWKYGDGESDSGAGPHAHTYDTLGTFTAWLVVDNDTTGCRDSTSTTIDVSKIVPGFTTDTTSGCNPLSIEFSDSSVSKPSFAIAGWNWDLGDGDTAASKDPTHVYDSAGVYDVELIVTDELGCKDTLRKDSLIDTKPLPEPGFYADTLTGCRPFDVSFTDTSSGENPIKTWVWNYGDGSPPDSTVNPDHTFSDRGEYDITLTVEDTFNCKQSLTRNQYIKPTYPYPAFDIPDPICDFETISPTNNSTGTGLSYVWDFGDGTNPDSTANPTHSYALDTDTTRTLPITLKATDVNGCDSTLVDSITISKPIAGFGVDSANANCPPFSVSFLDSSTSDVTAWEWDFGDNSTKSNLENPSHTYSDAGYYDVQLIVTNGAGCRDTLKKDSLIQIGGPSGSFTDSLIPNSCYKKFLFEASTKNTDSITWVFGDGAIGTGDTATHEYKVPGNYFPTLVLQDSAGCQVSIPADTAIEIPPNDFSADFTYDSVVCNGEPVNFNEQSTGTELSFAWDFGDGSPVDSSPNPTHVYPWVDSTQTWTVTFTATDSANCDTTITKDVTVSKPVTDFSADTTFAACPPLDVQFTDATAGNINDWQWDLGDSSTASSKNPIHSYDWPGQYDVSLVTTDIHGCKDTLVKDALILVEGPTGSFRYEEIPGTCFSEYRFMADTKASTVTWEFGDGATGSGDTTVYDYQNDPGTYQPVMIMEDSTGCRVELPADSLIDIPQNPLTAGFTIDTNNVFDAPVHFEDASSSSTPIVEWIWDFGDGNDLVDSTGSVEYKYDSVGTFQAKLIVTDENGCRDTVSRPIKIREGIRIPNVFTPNNDGTNDHFKIKNSGVRAYRLEIFNRWGEKIFSTNGPNVDWDGTTAGDRPAPEGTYYFTLRYKILDKGAVKQVQGSLTLLR